MHCQSPAPPVLWPLASSTGSNSCRAATPFFSVIISSTDEALYRKLGINVCCEPKYERVSLYHR
nr:DUF1846 domain-containing protein [Bifidobacterium longum]